MPDQPLTQSSVVPAGATPAMAQWFTAKAAYPDALLFFRMGDFYEMFFADAEAAAAALDIVLSHRGEHNGVPIAMCGVPKHAAESYLARLIRRGYRVAIAEQMEDPKTRASLKTPIRREVVRLITPGTITEDALLEAGQPNLLLALARDRDMAGAAWLDISTGLFETIAVNYCQCSQPDRDIMFVVLSTQSDSGRQKFLGSTILSPVTQNRRWIFINYQFIYSH